MVVMPKDLQLYTALSGRRSFNKAELVAFQNKKRGYDGERRFLSLLERHLDKRYLTLHNLLLEHQGTLTEIDCLLVFQHQLFLIEVKNYQGEFEWHSDYLYAYNTKKQYRNPVHQLQRTEMVLRDVLSSIDAIYQIHSYVVFVHPAFTLYQAEHNSPVILPTNLQAFFSRFQQVPDDLSSQHEYFVQQLEALRLPASPYTKYPEISYDQLRKDLFCKDCRNPMVMEKRKVICTACSYIESTDAAVLRHLIEFELLFPEKLITTGILCEWIGEKLSKVTLRKIVKHYMEEVINGKYTHYIFSK